MQITINVSLLCSGVLTDHDSSSKGVLHDEQKIWLHTTVGDYVDDYIFCFINTMFSGMQYYFVK